MSFFDTNIAPLPLEIYITIIIPEPPPPTSAPICITITISEWSIDLDIEEEGIDPNLAEWSITIEVDEWGIDLSTDEWNISLELECDGVPSQGETFRVTATIIDLDGNIVTNATGHTHSIRTYDPSGNLVDTETSPTYTGAGGIWTQDFTLLATAPIGGWRVFWIVTSSDVPPLVGIVKLPFWVSDP